MFRHLFFRWRTWVSALSCGQTSVRRGFTLTELVLSSAIIGIVMAGTLQLVINVNKNRLDGTLIEELTEGERLQSLFELVYRTLNDKNNLNVISSLQSYSNQNVAISIRNESGATELSSSVSPPLLIIRDNAGIDVTGLSIFLYVIDQPTVGVGSCRIHSCSSNGVCNYGCDCDSSYSLAAFMDDGSDTPAGPVTSLPMYFIDGRVCFAEGATGSQVTMELSPDCPGLSGTDGLWTHRKFFTVPKFFFYIQDSDGETLFDEALVDSLLSPKDRLLGPYPRNSCS